MNQALRDKRILTTRPAHQSHSWCALLRDAGARVDNISMLAIEPIDSGPGLQAIKNRILDFDQVDHAIFVSQNAVQHGFDWLDTYWPQLPTGPRYHAIGVATARALVERGADCGSSSGTNMDSEALLAQAELQQVQDNRILIFRGAGGRTLIGDTLAERGARVDYCELYRRALPADAAEQLRRYATNSSANSDTIPDAISVHSGETLDNLVDCIRRGGRRDLLDATLICPSERVAVRARAAGFSRVSAAQNASDSAMLAALQRELMPQLRDQ